MYEGHWLLPIQGGHVSKTRLLLAVKVDDTQRTARGIRKLVALTKSLNLRLIVVPIIINHI